VVSRQPTGIRASAVQLRLSDVLRSGNREREAGVQADPLAGTSATDEPRLGRAERVRTRGRGRENLCDKVPPLAVSDRQPWPR
jgi:hypothetical protein